MEIDKKQQKEIEEYCKLNDIQDINVFLKKIIKVGFDLEKWGNISQNKQKTEIIEKITKPITKQKHQISNSNSNIDDFYGEN